MDTLSHGLWGGMAFGRQNKRVFLIAFLFGVMPDVLAFGWEFFRRIFLGSEFGKPMVETIDSYIFGLYNITHSLIIALVALLIGLILFKAKAIPVASWALHILVDIPTHSTQFFPTPYLWPFATPYVNGIPWNIPWIFFSNWALLLVLYALWYYKRYANKKIM